MSQQHTLGLPNMVRVGRGVSDQIGALVTRSGAARVLLVTHPMLVELETFCQVESSLETADVEHTRFTEFDENPTATNVELGRRHYVECGAEAIVVVGGGSAIDCAKGIAIVAANGGSILDYAGMDKFAQAAVPLFAIPTTSGTGSEVSPYAVITDSEHDKKVSCSGWSALPVAALIDPIMTATMPAYLTAATGMDALSHALEALYAAGSMPQTDALARGAIDLVLEHLPVAVADGTNLEAREAMAVAAMMAGTAMAAGCGAVHALGHQLSNVFGIHHGLAMSLMMPSVINFTLHEHGPRTQKLADALRLDPALTTKSAGNAVSQRIVELAASVGLPTSLGDAGADRSELARCYAPSLEDGNMADNPVTPTLDQVEQLFGNAFDGRFEWLAP